MPEAFFKRGRAFVFRAATVLMAALLGSCAGGDSGPARPLELPLDPGSALAWPPAEDAELRSASDDLQSLPGSAFTFAGGEFTPDEEAGMVLLENGETLSYAIYGMADFGPELAFSGFNVNLHSSNPEDPAPQPRYVGVANYAKGRWEFFRKPLPVISETLANPADYVSPLGNAYIAVVQSSGDGTFVDSVEFIRTGDTNPPPTPENLVATADVGSITLSWDPVENAGGYFIYRSLQPDFSDPLRLNEVKVPDPAYVDDTVLKEVMYYYRVSAKRAVESGLSNMVDIFSPKSDLAAPQNPRFTRRTPTSTTVAWDWDDINPPFGFMLYYKMHANFNLDEPVIEKQVPAFARSSTLEGIGPHEIHYWRVAARGTQEWLGRMTDDIADPSSEFHVWSEPRPLGPGIGPVAAATGDDGITAVYYGAPSVASGACIAANISADVISHSTIANEGFGDYCDIAFGDRGYVVGMHELTPRDAWTAIGSVADGWTNARLAGDGVVNLVEEGHSMHLAASGDEFSLVHIKINGFGGPEVLYHNLPSGSDVWSTDILEDAGVGSIDHLSLAYEGSDVKMLWYNTESLELRFASRSAGWTFDPVFSTMEGLFGQFNDLRLFDGKYYSPAFDSVAKSISMLSSVAEGPWALEEVSLDGYEATGHCRSVVAGDKLVLVYHSSNPNMWTVTYLHEGEWHTEWPNIGAFSASRMPGLTVEGTTVWLFYEDILAEQVLEVHADYSAP